MRRRCTFTRDRTSKANQQNNTNDLHRLHSLEKDPATQGQEPRGSTGLTQIAHRTSRFGPSDRASRSRVRSHIALQNIAHRAQYLRPHIALWTLHGQLNQSLSEISDWPASPACPTSLLKQSAAQAFCNFRFQPDRVFHSRSRIAQSNRASRVRSRSRIAHRRRASSF